METTDYKFCPSCKLKNPGDAIICVHCGRPFESGHDPYSTTTEVKKPRISSQEILEEKIERATRPVPAEGIAIYIVGRPNPIEVLLEDEFIIGRLIEPTEEKIVDLTAYDGFALGVSRRHLKVRRVENGYEVVDLHSRNGTWVNDRLLEPESPLVVKSGAQIGLGNLRIVLAFQQPGKSGKPEQASHEPTI